jgi:hypothetical protein
LAKDIGFDAMFFGRADLEEKAGDLVNKTRMKIWRPSEENFGKEKDMLTLLMTMEQGTYCWPSGFAFDANYKERIVFPEDADNSMKLPPDWQPKMEHLRNYVQKLIDTDEQDEVYMTFGCDFAFTKAPYNYYFMDRVIKHWNQMFPQVKMMYSTPERYVESVKLLNEKYTANDEAA